MSSTNPTDHPPHLEPSQLGTKEYWESFYDNSLSHLSSSRRRRAATNNDNDDNSNNDTKRDGDEENTDDEEDDDAFSDEDSDPGTSWFTEHNAPEKVLRFLTSASFPLAPCNINTNTNTLSSSTDSQQQKEQPTILDLGTGNGSMLTLLRDEGEFTGPMVGVDYSEKSIELARRLHAHADGEGGGDASLRFEVWDVFDPRPVRELEWFPSAGGGGFDIVLDKGTFDAISLSAEVVVESRSGNGGEEEQRDMKGSRVVQRRVCERYPAIVRGLVRRGGFLVVTSCNWTEAELVKWFTGEGDGEGDGLEVWGRVEYPKFRFGGQEGQGVCTVCFQRVGGVD